MGVIPNDANLDDYKKPGMYSLDNYNVNSLWAMWAPLIISTSTGAITQQIITRYNGHNYIAIRRYSGNPSVWSGWDVFSNTGKLSELKTTNKDSVVSAVNEIYSNFTSRYFSSDLEKSSVSGYGLIATIKIKGATVGSPIKFDVSKRDQTKFMTLWIKFATLSSGTDPSVSTFLYEALDYEAYIHKRDISTWDIYVKHGTWQNLDIVDCVVPPSIANKIEVQLQKSSIVTEIPTGSIRATLT